MEKIILGGGCFWCVESVFRHVRGITSAVSGYAGGSTPRPDYESVCGGRTGHAEVVQLQYDPNVLPLRALLEVFFATHDPTTPNRQGNDVGTQYRSVIYFYTAEQERIARELMLELGASARWNSPIVTELLPTPEFFPAEAYHQNYFENHPDQPYCAVVIPPKLAKLEKSFGDRFREPQGSGR